MFNQDFEKILDLVKKTGDKIVVMPEFAAPFVVVPFEQYESLLANRIDYSEMSEEEILHKVNRDIALWKQSQRDLGLTEDVDYIENCTLWNKSVSQNEEEGEWLLDDFAAAEEETTSKDEKDSPAIIAPWKKDWSSEFKINNPSSSLQEEVIFPVEDLQTEIIKDDAKAVFAYEDVPPPPSIKKDLPVIDVDNEDIIDAWEEEEIDDEEDNRHANSLKRQEETNNADDFLVEPIE